ncbi:MAG: transglycosylase SLT domain-containing protein, partial [Longimicrobiales bacterium]|nr:transglycosylase SLT domain-containing protein [Longimicrobiales bacterium]
ESQRAPAVLRPATEPTKVDPILDSPWARAAEMDPKVQEWIESFQTREASLFRTSLARMGRYQGMVEEELRAAGLPASLAFLPIVESWYNPRAFSWVGASGLWQFMPPTARGMGLQVDRLIDERRDPLRSTHLALSYLSELNQQFDSWFLALAAYNGGPGRLDRILKRSGRGDEGHDGLFLEVLEQLPRETRDFVPRFLAAARIGRDPAAYGFDDVVPEAPWRFDEVVVPDAASLDVVARASQVDQGLLEELNPQLLKGLTPAGVPTRMRVPEGAGEAFAQAYARIPPEERVTFLEHSVTQGETLTHIALRYGVSVDDLQAMNPTVQPRRMRIGQRVVVPKAPSVRIQLRAGSGVAGGESDENLLMYRVRSGDTLTAIAVRHAVGVNDLLRWNSLSRTSVIHPGDQVKIFRPGG